ncbi:cell division protein ZipA [Pseudidiomarina sp. 1APP75-32.1]|uniref:Cell division protein ZipA n=1 Tax=Pseudidiomarina terrestris TaxID=2820060 RepID=A0AAW7QWU4_9GAMM|nr:MULTISPECIES: cell division protein ZipA [unclassified Pseudidiomarina]MDN7123906.1 cell division protein ZipA [Pseudidiomarina sp. 1APP75-32.1]MEA3588783.1 cell division protein ZipA [Pseudidiomarina sp. 1APP75-27a]
MSTMQIVFSVIGLLLIGLIIGHGMWNIRRNERRAQARELELERKRQQQSQPGQGFDDDGIGEVRVIKRASERAQERPAGAAARRSADGSHVARTQQPTEPREVVGRTQNEAGAQAAQQPTQVDAEELTPRSKPIRAMDDEGELDLPSLAAEPDELKQAEQQQPAKQKAKPKAASVRNKPEPSQPAQQSMELELEPGDEPALTQAPDLVIALHVMGHITGPVLLQQMTELGFKYGEFDIFHRHVDTAGQGPVLFSLANMFNPGTFDIDAMEQFETKGVALFLALPIKSNSTKAFTMMQNAAEKLAAAVDGGQVLDENRNPLTRQAVQHIHQNIREYERKRLIRQ